MRMNGLNGSEETDDGTAEAITALAGEMDAIKRLLVLLLMKGGASQTELAKALNVGQATISRFGIGKVKPAVIRTQNDQDEES